MKEITNYYSYIQVASIVGVSDTALRYWISELKDYISIDEETLTSGRFALNDIDVLINIKRLIVDDKLNLVQIKEYYSTNNGVSIVSNNSPEVIYNEFKSYLDAFKEDILSQQKDLILRLLDSQIKLNDDVVSMVSKVSDLKNEELYNKIEANQKEVIRVSNFNAEQIRIQLEERRKEANKSWWMKLLGK
jgi:hypothetical protein